MDQLQRVEISFLQNFQDLFSNYETWMLAFSHFGYPRNAFLLCFPIALCCISARTGMQVLWAAVVSEWLNAVLKWLLNGQRPYWWVMESPVFIGEERPFVKQFKYTCETGPGCPSGHVMVTSAVWYVVVASLNEVINAETSRENSQNARLYTKLTWATYSLFVLLVALSRVFIATHFPHQVILGLLIGILLGSAIRKYPLEQYGFGRYFLGGLFIIFTILLEYYILGFLNFDPGWSMKLALKRCVFREWVHLDTTLFYATARDVGAFIFAGMMFSCLSSLDFDRIRGQHKRKLAATLLTIAAAQVIESISVPRYFIALFYILGALKYGFVLICVIGLNKAVNGYGQSNHES